jgi:hypothetical protein
MSTRALRFGLVLLVPLVLGAASCGGGTATPPPDPTAGTISGTVKMTSWTKVSTAYWIGKNAPGGPAVTIFLFEAPVACADIVNANWDKTATGAHQILELSFTEQAARPFTVMTDVFAAYLLSDYNPDAFAGMVTLSAINATTNITGSFDLTFSLPNAPVDRLMGTFDAKYCADGVEP